MPDFTTSPPWGTDGPGSGMRAAVLDQEITPPARFVYITGTGNLVAEGFDGVEFTIAVPANFWLRVSVRKIKTGTTATGVFVVF